MIFLHCNKCGSKIDLDLRKLDEAGNSVKMNQKEATETAKRIFSSCPVCGYMEGEGKQNA